MVKTDSANPATAAAGRGRAKAPQKQAGGDTSKQGTGTAPKGRQTQKKASEPSVGDGGTTVIEGGQQHATGDTSSQGAGSNNQAPAVQKQMLEGVEIEYLPIPARGGKQKDEEYPFSKIGLSKRDESGGIAGPSFFIPEDDNPEKHLAQARKVVGKVKGEAEFLFHARTTVKDNVPGRRVWKTVNPKFKK